MQEYDPRCRQPQLQPATGTQRFYITCHAVMDQQCPMSPPAVIISRSGRTSELWLAVRCHHYCNFGAVHHTPRHPLKLEWDQKKSELKDKQETWNMMRNWWHISSLFKPRVGRQMGPLKDECGQRPHAVRHALLAPRPTNALLTKKGWTRSSNVSCISTIVLNNIWLRLWMRWWNASCICTIVLNSTFCSDFERVDEMYHGSLPILLNTMFLRISHSPPPSVVAFPMLELPIMPLIWFYRTGNPFTGTGQPQQTGELLSSKQSVQVFSHTLRLSTFPSPGIQGQKQTIFGHHFLINPISSPFWRSQVALSPCINDIRKKVIC